MHCTGLFFLIAYSGVTHSHYSRIFSSKDMFEFFYEIRHVFYVRVNLFYQRLLRAEKAEPYLKTLAGNKNLSGDLGLGGNREVSKITVNL